MKAEFVVLNERDLEQVLYQPAESFRSTDPHWIRVSELPQTSEFTQLKITRPHCTRDRKNDDRQTDEFSKPSAPESPQKAKRPSSSD